MFRTVNLRRSVEKMLPVFTERLGRSGFSDYSGNLELRGKDEAVVVTIEGGRALSATSGAQRSGSMAPEASVDGGANVVRLFVGDDLPERVCAQTGITLHGDAQGLVPVLFPHEEPQTILWDRF